MTPSMMPVPAPLPQFEPAEEIPSAVSLPATETESLLHRFRATLPDHLRKRLRSARALARERAQAPPLLRLPTGVAAFDRLLAGGLPRGRLVELIGRRSSGRFSTLLSAVAVATGCGEAAALIDLGDGLDPQAAERAGAVLERLLWVRPRHLKQALASAEMLLASGFPLVVIDLGNPPVPGGRGAEAAWLRLARSAKSHGAALLVASPYRVSGTAAATVVGAHRSRPAWAGRRPSPRLLEGLSSHLVLEKLQGERPGRTELLRLAVP